MRAAGVGIAIALALALQTTLARFVIGSGITIDLVLVTVVAVALSFGPASGLLAGSIGGMAQDALSDKIIGVGGLANTIVGFLAGVFGSQFIVVRPLPRFIVFFAGTVIRAGCYSGLYAMLEQRPFPSSYVIVRAALLNGVMGVVALQLFESIPGAVNRRRMGRPYVPGRRLEG